MNSIVTVFQFEIRYSHILNFSQIGRKIIAPYVKLAQSISVENQNSLEERLVLNFEDDEYLIIVAWDRLLIKGQNSISKYTEPNSPFQMPFLDILDKLRKLSEFGSIKNILFAINYIKKLDVTKDKLFDYFISKSLMPTSNGIIDKMNDIAIILESKEATKEEYITFGPYFDSSEILKRPIVPVKFDSLKEIDFVGIMAEYKYLKKTNEVSQDLFNELVIRSEKATNKLWKAL